MSSEHEIVLTLTDGHLGSGRFITQSLLLLVQDANDNPPVFSRPQVSVEVEEHVTNRVLATIHATDSDSGAFGQVRSTYVIKCVNYTHNVCHFIYNLESNFGNMFNSWSFN